MKLCKDCAWFEPSVTFPSAQHKHAKCGYGVKRDFSTVTGEEIEKREQPYSYCEILRNSTTEPKACGPDARFFMPKDPIAACVEGAMRDFLADALNPVDMEQRS